MAHTAIFEFEGAKAQVLDFNYSLSRSTDPEKGYPTKVVRNGYISLTIRSTEKEMAGKMISWMASQNKAGEGTITIYKDEEQTMEFKTVSFENGYVVGYRENFNSNSVSDNTLESFEITCEVLKIGGAGEAEFKMRWPDTE
ncbi:MAG: type VI secretion system tube protein TssD [Bacteroidota bacterium]